MSTPTTQTLLGITLEGQAWGVVIGAAITVFGAVVTAIVNQAAAVFMAWFRGRTEFRNTAVLEFNRDRTKMIHECWGAFVVFHDTCEELIALLDGGIVDQSVHDRKIELTDKYLKTLIDVRKYRIWTGDTAREKINAYIKFVAKQTRELSPEKGALERLGDHYQAAAGTMRAELFELANWGV